MFAQCSDAGACATGRLSPGPSHRLALSSVEASSGGPDDLRFHTLRFEGQFHLTTSTQVLLTVPFVHIQGPLGSTQGLGDLIALIDYTFFSDATGAWAVQVGSRLATGQADRSAVLPQAYQAGLGPSDLILGVRGVWGNWQSGAAYQRAGGRSDNPITRLKRGDDVLLWASRGLSIGATELTLKALAVKRLTLSTVRDVNSAQEQFVEVPKSDRLQLNLEAGLMHPLGRSLSLQAGAAIPFLKRSDNTDGLKRAWTITLGLAWAL